MKVTPYPKGWNEERVRRVLEHYEGLSEEELVAEDEAALDSGKRTVMDVPTDLVPKVRELIAKQKDAEDGT